MSQAPPILALTQGDPAGIGPEILLKLLQGHNASRYRPLLVAERAALEAIRPAVSGSLPELRFVEQVEDRNQIDDGRERVTVLDPVSQPRDVIPGQPGRADARGALVALDAGLDVVRSACADALVTAPVAKETIARWVEPGFRGHTDYLARRCGLERYGRDYLMTFLGADLRVALLSTHLPLREAIDGVTTEAVLEALRCFDRHLGSRLGRVAIAGLNPHAGEGGLLGDEEREILAPAVDQARREGLDVVGPESPDTVFARARAGEFRWVLALYHDQGLIAVKTAAFGHTANWTLGLPVLRTSVDHGTAFGIAGRGVADANPLRQVVGVTLGLLAETQSKEALPSASS